MQLCRVFFQVLNYQLLVLILLLQTLNLLLQVVLLLSQLLQLTLRLRHLSRVSFGLSSLLVKSLLEQFHLAVDRFHLRLVVARDCFLAQFGFELLRLAKLVVQTLV